MNLDLDPPYDLSKVLIIAPFGLQTDYVQEKEEFERLLKESAPINDDGCDVAH